MSARAVALLVLSLAVTAPALAQSPSASPANPAPAQEDQLSPRAKLQADAAALAPLVRTALAREFLAGVAALPAIETRTVWRDSARTNAWTAAEVAAMPDTQRARLVRRDLDETFYWNTRYGSPLAYVRALELLGERGMASARGRRVADFGCGTLGHLRLLALAGAAGVGIDVDPVLRALYSAPGDQGAMGERGGSARLVVDTWPATASSREAVGEGYDLFLSKNTLKRGYIHPAEKVDPRMLVRLGVGDSAYVAEVWRMLKPGGRAMVYNLSPAPAPPGKPYIPWADGRCGFERAVWERQGFRVLAYDVDDGAAARAMGHALGWDAGENGMKLESDLFAHWSLFEKPAGGARTKR